jgi:hypothetical protein
MAEMDPFGTLTGRRFPVRMPEQSVNASHWYDLALLLTKTFDPRVSVDPLTGERTEGPAALCERYVRQLGRLKALASAFLAARPR